MKKILFFLVIASIVYAKNIKIKCVDTYNNVYVWELSNTLDTLYTHYYTDKVHYDVLKYETMTNGIVNNPDHLIYVDTTKMVYENNFTIPCKVINNKKKSSLK